MTFTVISLRIVQQCMYSGKKYFCSLNKIVSSKIILQFVDEPWNKGQK